MFRCLKCRAVPGGVVILATLGWMIFVPRIAAEDFDAPVEVGDTAATVEERLGSPDSWAQRGSRELYLYEDVRIHLRDGVVESVFPRDEYELVSVVPEHRYQYPLKETPRFRPVPQDPMHYPLMMAMPVFYPAFAPVGQFITPFHPGKRFVHPGVKDRVGVKGKPFRKDRFGVPHPSSPHRIMIRPTQRLPDHSRIGPGRGVPGRRGIPPHSGTVPVNPRMGEFR